MATKNFAVTASEPPHVLNEMTALLPHLLLSAPFLCFGTLFHMHFCTIHQALLPNVLLLFYHSLLQGPIWPNTLELDAEQNQTKHPWVGYSTQNRRRLENQRQLLLFILIHPIPSPKSWSKNAIWNRPYRLLEKNKTQKEPSAQRCSEHIVYNKVGTLKMSNNKTKINDGIFLSTEIRQALQMMSMKNLPRLRMRVLASGCVAEILCSRI